MKDEIFPAFLFMIVPILLSCTGQADTVITPVPGGNYLEPELIIISIEDIIDTEYGNSYIFLPGWMRSFINGGIEEIEKSDSFAGKYVFMARNEGANLSARKFWVSNFSEVNDFSILAAKRIEKRMISAALLYPDDEYGAFFETMVKNANNVIYSGAVKADSCWIKLINNNEPDNEIDNSEIYVSFLLLTIDRTTMQRIISGMISETMNNVSVSRVQRNNITRLQLSFFSGF
ncbi:MAG: hypothetical protein FWC19_06590 [Treponema sp.]|nr:hypothetical protein [Treponema sp.]MCL2272452.1 hypothetical protein [Treponema sp.]